MDALVVTAILAGAALVLVALGTPTAIAVGAPAFAAVLYATGLDAAGLKVAYNAAIDGVPHGALGAAFFVVLVAWSAMTSIWRDADRDVMAMPLVLIFAAAAVVGVSVTQVSIAFALPAAALAFVLLALSVVSGSRSAAQLSVALALTIVLALIVMTGLKTPAEAMALIGGAGMLVLVFYAIAARKRAGGGTGTILADGAAEAFHLMLLLGTGLLAKAAIESWGDKASFAAHAAAVAGEPFLFWLALGGILFLLGVLIHPVAALFFAAPWVGPGVQAAKTDLRQVLVVALVALIAAAAVRALVRKPDGGWTFPALKVGAVIVACAAVAALVVAVPWLATELPRRLGV